LVKSPKKNSPDVKCSHIYEFTYAFFGKYKQEKPAFPDITSFICSAYFCGKKVMNLHDY